MLAVRTREEADAVKIEIDADLGLACLVCGAAITDCACLDADEKLRRLTDSIDIVFKWCRGCAKHYRRCRCAVPDFGLRTGGRWYSPVEVEAKFKDLYGRPMLIDSTTP